MYIHNIYIYIYILNTLLFLAQFENTKTKNYKARIKHEVWKGCDTLQKSAEADASIFLGVNLSSKGRRDVGLTKYNV